jgi:hypothetical protein
MPVPAKFDQRNGLAPALLILLALIGSLSPLRSKAQGFFDVADPQGLDFTTFTITFGAGVSFFDFNNDGWDDLSFAMRGDSLEFYLNIEGQLQRAPSFVPVVGDAKQLLWVDYDNDGHHDLFISSFSGRHRLYRNDGLFNFTDVSEIAGLILSNEKNFGASWGDYDRDGFLDLYVCTYESEGTEDYYERLNHLYRNNGDGTFTDVTLAAGVGNGIRFSFQSVWMDYDMDGWPDLFVINDRIYANTLYRNNGDGTFTDVTDDAGVGFPNNDPMTITVGDFDNDGDLDIFMTNSAITSDMACILLVNNGDGTFTDRAADLGVNVLSWSWGGLWVDYNNDTFQDLYFTTSDPNGPMDTNRFFTNMGGQGFEEANSVFTGSHVAASFSCARGDLDNDGYYDIVVHNLAPDNPFLWQNTGGSNNHVKVTLRGTVSNRPAIGSWIRVYAGGQQYTQYTHCGENFIGQNSQHHIFGLGQSTEVDSIQVEYVSGHVDTYRFPDINTTHLFTEGETYMPAISPQGPFSLCSGTPLVLDAGEHASYLWNTGFQGRFLVVEAPGTYWFTAQNEFGVAGQSDSVVVDVFPSPEALAQVVPPSCSGGSDGSISLENTTGVDIATVVWNNGVQANPLTGVAEGTYSYLLTDANGCTATSQLLVVGPDPLTIQAIVVPDPTNDESGLELYIFGGTPPFLITLNGEPSEAMVPALPPGTYTVLVTDANGCSWEGDVLVGDQTGIMNVRAARLGLFPNPARDEIRLDMTEAVEALYVAASDGRVVMYKDGLVGNTVPVGNLANGMYHVHVRSVTGRLYTARFIKMD